MCGITGIVSRNSIDSKIVKAMNDKISHRGPDGAGFLIGGDITGEEILIRHDRVDVMNLSLAFGHRRLSILDLSESGHQPMSYMNGRYWIVYNGEIFNFESLRDELVLDGFSFKSNSDTEVVLAAYHHWGKECVKKFNGMWTFIIIDSQEQKIYMSRDRFGIKPFYYYQDEEHFIFGSEIKSLLEHPCIKNEFNEDFLNAYLENGSQEYSKATVFKNIYRFNIASYYECAVTEIFNPFQEVTFWKLVPNLSNENFDAAKAKKYADQYYNLLSDAVKLRLRADVKVGSALSGGLDSSSIVYLINQQLKALDKADKQETFSTVYSAPGTQYCDESTFIDEMAGLLNVYAHKIEPIESHVKEEHNKIMFAIESPPDGTLMSSWHTYKLVKSTDIVVTLDGQGADEQLGGYLPYIIHHCANLPLWQSLSSLKHFRKTNTLKYALIGFVLNLTSKILGKNLTNRMANIFNPKKKDYFMSVNERLHLDTHQNLVTLLHYADHTSMAHSIESRVPFMDYRLMEFLSNLPACYKIHNGWTKYIARLAFDKKLPDSINWRKDKMGWPIPEKVWFYGGLNNWYNEELNYAEEKLHIQLNRGKLPLYKGIRFLNFSVFDKLFKQKH